MKLFVALITLFLAVTVQAEVKKAGTFVARLCSEKIDNNVISADIVRVESVCVGAVAKQDVLSVRLNDGTRRLYKLDIVSQAGRMGINVEKFTGTLISKRQQDKIRGSLSTTSGVRVTYGITFKTESNLRYSGPLMPMRHTMTAVGNSKFYQCGGFMGVDEYRVGIDVDAGKAGFFDNDTTTILKLKSVKILESQPPQYQYTFESEEDGRDYYQLVFNKTLKSAYLSAIDHEGEVLDMGTAECEIAEPWDLEE
jgi:hypothetical protein